MTDRRAEDAGWRKLNRDYGLIGAILAVGIAFGALQTQVASAADERKEIKEEQKEIVKIQRQQARTNGQVQEAVETIKIQNQQIQKMLWQIQQHVRPKQ